MKVRLTEKKEIAEQTYLFGFSRESDGFSYVPGQYVRLKLPLLFTDDKGDTRFFSIVNPDGHKIKIATPDIRIRLQKNTLGNVTRC